MKGIVLIGVSGRAGRGAGGYGRAGFRRLDAGRRRLGPRTLRGGHGQDPARHADPVPGGGDHLPRASLDDLGGDRHH